MLLQLLRGGARVDPSLSSPAPPSQVVRARNVPVRRALATRRVGGGGGTAAGGAPATPFAAGGGAEGYDPRGVGGAGVLAGGLDYLSNDGEVFSLVEARFQGRSARSSAAPGPTPQWNQVRRQLPRASLVLQSG